MTKYPIEVFWSDEDEGYIATLPDLPGCSAWGTTEAEAIMQAHDASAAWIKAAKAAGDPVPETPAVNPDRLAELLWTMHRTRDKAEATYPEERPS